MLQTNKLSVSKWLKIQVLLDALEMEDCLAAVAPFEFYNVSAIAPLGELKISHDVFLKEYQTYIEELKAGKIPEPDRKIFSAVATVDPSAIVTYEVQPGRWMAKLSYPLVQLQHHRFFASKVDHKVHSMVMSPESIHWGLQFSFPQIFLGGAGSYKKTSEFPNAALFAKLQKWLRAHSVPATFVFDGVKVGTSIRLGKKCFEWIHRHPQLIEQDVQVYLYTGSA